MPLIEVLNPVKRAIDSRKQRHKKGQPVGYNDVKDYLDSLISCIDRTGVTGVVLYGSIARGKGRKGSDIDLLFISENKSRTNQEVWQSKYNVPYMSFGDFLKNRRLDISTINEKVVGLYELDEPGNKAFAYNIADDGVVLYDVDGQTRKYLDRLKSEPHEKDWLVP